MTPVTLLAVLALSLVPFGTVSNGLKTEKVWRAFLERGPILTFVRAEKLTVDVSCVDWVKALEGLPYGGDVSGAEAGVAAAFRAWAPWTEDENEWLSECDQLPCKFKLNEDETKRLKEAAPADRKARFITLVESRIAGAMAGKPRKGCEFPGEPVEPWAALGTAGFTLPLKMPEKGRFSLRKLDLAPGKMKPLRQVMEKRFAQSRSKSGQRDAVLWVRDVYTTHYFDSWGEWLGVSCDDRSREAAVVIGMLLELDLVKDEDFITRLSHGRIISAVEGQGMKYLDGLFESLRKAANVRKSE